MTQARLVVTLPEGIWIGDVSRTQPEATFEVLSAVPDANAAFALLRVTGPEIEPPLSAVEDHDHITEFSSIQRTDGEATIQVETISPPLLQSAARGSGLPIEFPVAISDGEATVDVTGSHERLAALGDQLRGLGLEFDIEYIQERLHTSQLLTESQYELVRTAVDHGYYDTPRSCTLTELADSLDLAKSTCSERLHRAEEAMIKRFIDDLPTPMEAETRITGSE